jgi:hypothetical protein
MMFKIMNDVIDEMLNDTYEELRVVYLIFNDNNIYNKILVIILFILFILFL